MCFYHYFIVVPSIVSLFCLFSSFDLIRGVRERMKWIEQKMMEIDSQKVFVMAFDMEKIKRRGTWSIQQRSGRQSFPIFWTWRSPCMGGIRHLCIFKEVTKVDLCLVSTSPTPPYIFSHVLATAMAWFWVSKHYKYDSLFTFSPIQT